MNPAGNLFVIAAPSGAGKTTLVKALVRRNPDLKFSISYTTRAIRETEKHGRDYFFVSEDEFLSLREQDELLESAMVFDNHYGTSRSQVADHLARGDNVILEIDWQGAQQVRKLMADAVSIFILPPSREALLERLNKRGQDSAEIIHQRMAEAVSEMSHYHEFDYLVVNDQFERSLLELHAIFLSNRQRIDRQVHRHQSMIEALLV